MRTRIVTCIDCGLERTIRDRNDQPPALRCRSCNMRMMAGSQSGELSHTWRGGRIKKGYYKRVKLFSQDPFFSMAHCDGYALEHRLVVARALERCLVEDEVVHHKNGFKKDNRLDNLQLLKGTEHNKLGRMVKAL